MRIGIDASWASAVGTGTASYTAGLVEALVINEEHEFVLYFRPGDEDENHLFHLTAPNIARRCVAGPGQMGRTLVSLTRALKHDNLDVFHSPGYFLPLWTGPKVVTFHDANMFLQWEKWWRPGLRQSWLSLCGQTILASRLAVRVVADSHDAATSIRKVLHLADKRVTVLYPGIGEDFFKAADHDGAQRLREEHHLSRYLLYVGVLSPQKNLEGIVRAFALLKSSGLKLVLIGREDGAYYRQILRPLIGQLSLQLDVEVLGVVPREALRGLYRTAAAMLYPSFAEGFGLPPLEAMASGTPVVASNQSSLPEVLGDAALLVDPLDVAGIAEATQRVIADASLRATLVERGALRAAQFRWATTAERALQIYAAAA